MIPESLTNALRVAQEWQPIETAPKDGTPVLLWDAGLIGLFYWGSPESQVAGRRWRETWVGAIACGPAEHRSEGLPPVLGMIGSEATHWMPLPSGPQNRTKPDRER